MTEHASSPAKPCSVDGCDEPSYCRGCCHRHYRIQRRHGSPVAPDARRCRKPRDIRERFWEKVDMTGGPDKCWPWNGCRSEKGYGTIRIAGKTKKAHRQAYEFSRGPIPEGMEVRHVVCDNPPCCNPDHLGPGTHTENMHDMAARGRGWWQKKAAA